MDDTICVLDRERSEVHHGLDNLNTELPLPDPKVIYPKTVSILVVTQEFKVFQEIFLFDENLLSLVATGNNVVEPTLKLYPEFPGHGSKLQTIILNVNI